MIVLDLIQNIALLVALAAVYQVLAARLKKNTIWFQILSGLLFGVAGVLGMLTPMHLLPGIIFDGRSIVLSVVGLFVGPLAALIAALMCAAYRLWLGGAGMVMGLGVIFSSTLIGIGFHSVRKRYIRSVQLADLWWFGFLVHVVMLGWTFALPNGAGHEVVRQIDWMILTLYPLATVLVCLLFQDYEAQIADRAALLASQAETDAIYQKSSSGYVITGPDGALQAVNPAFAAMLGYQMNELTQVHFSGLTHPDDLPASHEVVRSLLAGEQDTITFEKRYLHKNGQTVWTLVNTVLLRDIKNQPLHFFTHIEDITPRKQMEEALRESEATLRSMIDAVDNSLFLIELDGRVVAVNQTTAERLGTSVAELIGRNIYDYVPVEVAERRRAYAAQAIATGQPVRFEDERFGRWIDNSIYPVVDAVGQVWRLAIYGYDRTEQKRAEQAVRENEDLLNKIFEILPVGLWITDANGRSFRSNEAGRKIWGARLMGHEDDHLHHARRLPLREEVGPHDWAHLHSIREGVTVMDELLEIDALDGQKRIILNYSAPVLDEHGQVKAAVIVNLDITERERAETALRENEALLNKIFDIMPVGLWLSDESGGLVRSNAAGRKIWGAEPLVGQESYGVFKARRLPSNEEIAPDDWSLAHTINEGVTVLDELLEIDAFDGQKRIILNYSAPVMDEHGQVKAAIVVNLDVTGRVRAEAAVRQSEDTLRSMIDAVNESLLLMELDGTVLAANQTLAERMGTDADTLIGRNIYDYVPAEVGERRRAYIAQVIATAQLVHFEDERFGRSISNSIYPLVDETGQTRRIAIYGSDRTDQKRTEQAARDNQDLLNKIFDILPIGLSITNADGKVIRSNAAGLKIWAADRLEDHNEEHEYHARRLPSREEIAPRDWAHLRSLREGVMVTDELLEIDAFDGQKRIILNYSAPVLDEEGRAKAAVFVNLDITDRERNEEARRESDERFSLAMQTTSDGLFDINLVTDERYCNPAYFRMLGYEPDEFVVTDENWYALMHPDDRERIAKINQGYIENRFSLFEGEFRLRTKSGAWKWILGRAKAVSRDANGRATRIIGTQMDIDVRKRMEEALRTSEERFRLAMQATSDGLYDANIVTGERYFSPSYFKMLGYEPDEFAMLEEEWYELMHPDDRERIAKLNKDYIENRIPGLEGEFRLCAKNGAWKWILGRGRAVSRDANGHATRVIGTQMDITERKRLEEQREEALRALQSKIDELERFNHLTVDRELRMIELKKEINALLVEMGRPEKYRIVE